MSIAAQFGEDGYAVLRNRSLARKVMAASSFFRENIYREFHDDVLRNRNLLKRFGDSLQAARIYADPALEIFARRIGLKQPVFSGPVVTHYTSTDLTGGSYSLPYHQDWPSMAGSSNSVIVWVTMAPTGRDRHGIELVPGTHKAGLAAGEQTTAGYVLASQDFEGSIVPELEIGDVLVFSAFLIHRTYMNLDFAGWKLSLSRRLDDLSCEDWARRGFLSAYNTAVDRDAYLR